MQRILHSSDWHLGKPFAGFEGDLPSRLREARHGVIGRLAAEARRSGARLVLVAGDIFDAETPAPQVPAQALAAMAEAADLTWALLPGNHDPARPGGLWERIAADRPGNLVALTEAAPVEALPGLWLLPSPLGSRDPGRDPTLWMDTAETPEGALRVGIAHGAVHEFDTGRVHSAAIAPDRPARAGLDYLALGDWHSALQVGPRVWYSGTPEPDRFGLPGAGSCLAAALPGGGGVPEVERVPVARFAWIEAEERLAPGAGAAAETEILRHLPEGMARRDVLLRLALTGRARLPDRAAWEAAAERLAPALARLELDLAGLEIAVEAEDLDRIGRGGALRAAAETLRAEAEDAALDAPARQAAREALDMLYGWCVEEETATGETDTGETAGGAAGGGR
ncbi:DNA repair exonuclease [Paralimibaculum aggregatum]|uniref:DNA repair exonuclease n=1 Tax=Paralimibaculum aggregatum TaxID=3036245 RepID=A0ABQ6LTP5_9RHOB|nr:metallophosphoesterase [Limibaculum sp. NKW23]GMG85436.1 DNA repair exonuclease [Limibaculum sp. NKW23]